MPVILENDLVATISSISNNVTLSKTKRVVADNGKIVIDDVIITGMPGTFIYLKITSDSLN